MAARTQLVRGLKLAGRHVESASAVMSWPASNWVWCYANEQPLRTMLRLSLDPQTNIQRPGHRSGWIAEALAPGRDLMTPETYGRLSKALTLLLGIDPVVVMKDIAGASRDEALDALEWTARTLVSAALNEASTPKLPKEVSLNKVPKSTRKTRPVSS
jgi:hypothetical protein